MPDKDIDTYTPYIGTGDESFTPQFRDYLYREACRKTKEREYNSYVQNRQEYREVVYSYKVNDKIVVYDDEGLQFGYIVRVKKLEPRDALFDLVVIVIRLTDKRVVFAILPWSNAKQYRLPWLKYFNYTYAQKRLKEEFAIRLESKRFENIDHYDFKARERIIYEI